MKHLLTVLALSLLSIISFAAENKPAQSIDELRQQIEKILKDTKTPGASVAIVHRDGPEWVAGVGKADVAANRSADANTLFRIGSTSKAFVSFAILKLVNEGKLSLDDPVRKVAPEVWFENRWEATDPVRVVDLLEHTTGWDDMHLREYVKDGPPSMNLREALDYDHDSRTSRWPPGTRMSYCNSGPAVAAYIVEKLSGQRFEDYVAQNFFIPIGMKTATYFPPPAEVAVTLYRADGKSPYPYWNIIYRPSGAINASANDMAAYVMFYLNRGAAGSTQILPPASLDRAEIPTRTWAARAGLTTGYGLGNYTSIDEGFVYHGHNGGVNGGQTEMAYLTDAGVGYFYSVNSGSDYAFKEIGKKIRAYITRNLQKPVPLTPASLQTDTSAYAGWYEPDSPRIEMFHFVERLLGITYVRFKGGKLFVRTQGNVSEFTPASGAQFRQSHEKDPDPVASLMFFSPDGKSKYMQIADGTGTMKRIPTWFAITEIVVIAWVLLAIGSVLLYAPFWVLGGLNKKRRRPAERAIRLLPLIAVLSLLITVGVFISAGDDIMVRLGTVTPWSLTVCISTLIFAATSLASVFALWRTPKEEVRKGVRRFSAAVIYALLVASAYLAWWSVIGLRTWA